MRYTIHTQFSDRHNDWIEAHDGHHSRGTGRGDRQKTHDTEEDGHPVVINESGVELDEDGNHVRTTYHDKRCVRGPAQSWEEAKDHARLDEDEYITEKGPSGLQSGNPDFYAVEVISPQST
ncbi:hypothetical protein [Salinibacter ruber]|uniref:Uncharacterized protein n=1 Tax=Salinibacter ruber TaxID=146919 RepID=A0A9X2Q7E4_9BACT|nr:hypothetical protein [Salinibacter ruber]MCS3661760.1 hypothetical protein [Salinibacter ruber]MCS3711579.1 hypothetical protein [Salinibacter ruber]